MKNNQIHAGYMPVNPALIQAHSSVYRAMADVNFAIKILSKHADRGAELGAHVPARHSRIVGELREMLFDVQQLIGRATLMSVEKQLCTKAKGNRHE